MKRMLAHLRANVFRGMIVIIPIALTAIAISFLYSVIDRRVAVWISVRIGYFIPGLGIVLVLIALYLLGLSASNVLGRQVLRLLERITKRIPIVRTTYQVGQQIGAALSVPGRRAFQRVVLIEHLYPGSWAIGFVTGSIEAGAAVDGHPAARRLLKVFVPLPPNPTTGFLLFLPPERTRELNWTIEEGLKTVISAGMIGPDELTLAAGTPARHAQSPVEGDADDERPQNESDRNPATD